MKLHIACVGRLNQTFTHEGCHDYAARIKRYLPLTITELKEYKSGRKQDINQIVNAESDDLAKRVSDGTFIVALDMGGQQMSTEQLAGLLDKHQVQGVPGWTFLIGGPYGLSSRLLDQADLVLSLSAMTLTHQMARLILLEQLYRCCTILRNEPYHHRARPCA
jgi:23S rRNA (pseudouridine1915-N3)-methyltransferase